MIKDIAKAFGQVIGLVDQVVEDKDQSARLKTEIAVLQLNVELEKKRLENELHIAGLQAKTTGWADSIYKLAPLILNCFRVLCYVGGPFLLLTIHPNFSIQEVVGLVVTLGTMDGAISNRDKLPRIGSKK